MQKAAESAVMRPRGNPTVSLAAMLVALTAGSSAPVAAASESSAPSRELAFDVQLDGRGIGSHTFVLTPDGADGQRVKSTARFEVKLLGIRVYRYRHDADERWQRGCVQSLAADTDDNGDKVTVRGARTEGAFRLEQPQAGSISSSCVATYAYWDLALLRKQQHLLNPQTGKWDAARLESVGAEELKRNGVSVPAQHYRLHAAELVIDLWYSRDGEWLQLGSDAKGKRRLMYLRRD
jgi:hypothetical protein